MYSPDDVERDSEPHAPSVLPPAGMCCDYPGEAVRCDLTNAPRGTYLLRLHADGRTYRDVVVVR